MCGGWRIHRGLCAVRDRRQPVLPMAREIASRTFCLRLHKSAVCASQRYSGLQVSEWHQARLCESRLWDSYGHKVAALRHRIGSIQVIDNSFRHFSYMVSIEVNVKAKHLPPRCRFFGTHGSQP